jgi:tetratricopeptide (TPR) repeat protein
MVPHGMVLGCLSSSDAWVLPDMLTVISDALPLPSKRFQAVLLLGLIILGVGLLAFRSIDDLDYGIHVGTGRWIIQHGRVPITDPFTWSIPEHAYVAYHWAFQVLAAGLYARLGDLGPVLMRFVLILCTALTIARTLFNRRVDLVIGGACALLALVAAELRFAVRPELFTYLFLALTAFVIDRWKQGSRASLLALPLIFVGWVNTHIYILGFVLLFAELFEQVVLRRIDRRFCVILAVTGAALFINPYGLEAVMEPVRLFTRMNKDNIFAQHITELVSPLAIHDDPRTPFRPTIQFAAWFLLIGASVPALVGLLRSRRIADAVVLMVFGMLSLVAVRNIALFAVVAPPLVACGLTQILSPDSEKWNALRRIIFYVVVVFASILCVRVSTGAWYAHQRRAIHLAPRVERAALALDAAEFVERINLKGRGFNNFNVGGALILGAPSHQIYIDGRNEVTGEAFFKNYLETLQPKRFDSFVESFNIEYVVMGHSNMMPLIRHLLASQKWTVVHYDSVAVVIVRKDGPNGHLSAMPLPSPIQNEAERWEYLNAIEIRPSVIDSFSRWLLGTEEVPFEKDRLGTFLLTAGQWKEAERPLLQSAVLAPNFWETSNNLGALYMRLKSWELVTLVYRNVLMLNPSDPVAKERAEMSWFKFKQTPVERGS